jgi:two-component system response regulator HydG
MTTQVAPVHLYHSRCLSLLIVDDEGSLRDSCRQVAEALGFEVFTADSVASAGTQLELHPVDVVLLDFHFPSSESLGLLARIKQQQPRTEVIVTSEHSTVDLVLAAMKSGAHDYVRKPFSMEELKLLLQRVAGELGSSLEGGKLKEDATAPPSQVELVGLSPEMEKLYRITAKVASSRHPVLIQGESGTGKKLMARVIHFSGPFRDRPFITVDCSSMLPQVLENELFGYVKGAFAGATGAKEGLLSLARGGTVLLNAISEMPLDIQGRLFRALQEKEIRPAGSAKPVAIDVRVIAASSRDLETAVQHGGFRRDLYSRLNVVSLRLPPLRERKSDIKLLADHFFTRIYGPAGVRCSVSNDALKQLMAYDWPGNVRELEDCIERGMAISSSPVLKVSDLPPQIQNANVVVSFASPGSKPRILPLAEVEKQAIISALQQLDGDKLMTAKLLGIGKTTLYRKLKQYGITDQWSMAISPSAKTG